MCKYTIKCNKLKVTDSGQSCHGKKSVLCDAATVCAMVHSTRSPRRVKILESKYSSQKIFHHNQELMLKIYFNNYSNITYGIKYTNF